MQPEAPSRSLLFSGPGGLLLVVLPVCLGIAGWINYLLFHTAVELFALLVGAGLFMIAWNTRRYVENDFLVYLGAVFFFPGWIDFLHILTYKGMGVWPNLDANRATQFWLAARYLQSIALMFAPAFLHRKNSTRQIFVAGSVLALLLISAVVLDFFPVAYGPYGLTSFKIASEGVISSLFCIALVLFYRQRKLFDPRVFKLLVIALVLTIFSELAFVFYISIYGIVNFLGHLLRLYASVFIYMAIIETGLNQPFNLLFLDLKRREQELQDNNDRVQYLATHDSLTGLPNRSLLWDRINQAIERQKRAGHDKTGKRFAIFVMDMDKFKEINDTYGHRAGDQALSWVAQQIQACLRSSDTVSRLGGDEFVALIHDIRTDLDAIHLARKVLKAVSEPLRLSDQEVFLTLSLGISIYPLHGQDADTLIHHADLAMYQAKGRRNMYKLYGRGAPPLIVMHERASWWETPTEPRHDPESKD